jgi:hypothetical protein
MSLQTETILKDTLVRHATMLDGAAHKVTLHSTKGH